MLDLYFLIGSFFVHSESRIPAVMIDKGTSEKKKRLGTLGFVTIVAHEERKKIHMTIFRKLITRIFLTKS